MTADDATLTREGLAASGEGRVLVIGCGALAREILAVLEANRLAHVDLTCLPAILHNTPDKIVPALEAALGESETAKLIWKPQAPTEIADLDTAQKLMRLIETLEDDDDVQNVTGNFDLSDEVAAQL